MRQLKVGSVMTTDVVHTEHDASFKEIAGTLAEHRVGGLPVVDEDGHVVGVVSETDLTIHQAETRLVHEPPRGRRFAWLTPRARRRTAKAHARTAGELMTTPAITVHAQDTVVEAARTMVRHQVHRLPVLDEEGRLVGIVSRHDLVRTFLRTDEEIREEVIHEVLERGLWLGPHSIDVTVTQGVVTLRGRMERRSEAAIAVAMTLRTDGVVDVVGELTHRFDDSRPQTGTPAVHGIADDWLRHL